MTRKDFKTHLMITALALPLALCIPPDSHAGDIGVSIHFGVPPRPVIVPRPVYRRPVPTFYFQESPEFVFMPSLNFSVAMGSPYDLFYHDNNYFIFHLGYWYSSYQLHGPWRIVDYRALPPSFHRHRIEQIRRYRDAEYNVYRHQRRNSPDRRYAPHYYREHRERDHRDYREERRAREYERRHR